MQEIKCPHCGKVFSVDESGYAQIVRQVRDREFEKDLAQRAREITQAQEQAQALARMEQEKAKSELEARKNSALADKDREIARLNALLENAGTAQELAVTEAVQSLDNELSDRRTQIGRAHD